MKALREFWVWPADDANDDDVGCCFKSADPNIAAKFIHVTELPPGHIVVNASDLHQAWLEACAARLDGVVELDTLHEKLFGHK